MDTKFDIFISHASEDKEALVRPLALQLNRLGFRVWYDEFTLKLGDSLLESIDNGLARSTCGLVVLSTAFFNKRWTKKELGGLFAKNIANKARIIPIWHEIDQDWLIQNAPMLADILAIKSESGPQYIANKIAAALRPEEFLFDLRKLMQDIVAAEKYSFEMDYEKVIHILHKIDQAHETSEHSIQDALKAGKAIYASSLIHLDRCQTAANYLDEVIKASAGVPTGNTYELVLRLLRQKAICKQSNKTFEYADVIAAIGAQEYKYTPSDFYYDPIFGAAVVLKKNHHEDIYFALLQLFGDFANPNGNIRQLELRAYSLSEICRIERKRGNYKKAIACSNKLLAELAKSPKSQEIKTILAWTMLEQQRSFQGNNEFQRAIDCSVELSSRFSGSAEDSIINAIAWSLAERALSHKGLNELESAQNVLQKYLSQFLGLSETGKLLPQTAFVLGEVALLFRRQGKLEAALKAINNSIDFCKYHQETDVVYELAWSLEEKAIILVENEELTNAITIRESIIATYSYNKEKRFRNLIARSQHHIGFIQILIIKSRFQNGSSIGELTGLMAEAKKRLLTANSINESASTFGALGYLSLMENEPGLARVQLDKAFSLDGEAWINEEIQDSFRYEIPIDAVFRGMLSEVKHAQPCAPGDAPQASRP